jgi:nitrite reductase (NADH) small subunit/3-phenylpropionate/trans-cinnamate dioxygenase ferredoxin subunit
MSDAPTEFEWFFIAELDQIPKNEGRAFAIKERMIAVFESDGNFYALDDFCPHQGASLSAGWIHEGCVACPWHAWRFSLSDGTWADNPKIKTDHFPIQIRGSELFVGIPAGQQPPST